MELSDFVSYEREFPLEIVDPRTYKTKTPKTIGLTFMVRHMECQAAREVHRKSEEDAIKGKAWRLDKIGREVAVACVTGWEWGIGPEGKPLKWKGEENPAFSEGKLREVLADPDMSWAVPQITDGVREIGNFMID